MRLYRNVCTLLAALALTFASLQAAAGVRVLCVGGDGHVRVENLTEQSSGTLHRIGHHRSGAAEQPASTNTGAIASSAGSQDGYGFDLQLNSDWTGVSADARGPKKPTPTPVFLHSIPADSVEHFQLCEGARLPVLPASSLPPFKSVFRTSGRLLL